MRATTLVACVHEEHQWGFGTLAWVHPATDNWQKTDEYIKELNLLGGCYQSKDCSSTNLNVEEAVGWAGTRGAEIRLHMRIYTHMQIKCQIWISTYGPRGS